MSAEELASRLGIGRALVYKGTRDGHLPAKMIGHRFYCRRDWVRRFEQGEPGFWNQPPGEEAHRLPVDSRFVVRVS